MQIRGANLRVWERGGMGGGWWVVLCWALFRKKDASYFIFSIAKIVQKMEKPTPRMDEFTHKMEDSTMKHKTPILE
jgi:hypothetical protein